jgi:hypothetical protein
MAAAAASAAAFGGGVTAAKAAAAADGGFGLLSSGSLLLREANVDGSGANSGASSGATGGGGLLGAGGAGGNASAGCLLADMCDGSSSCDGSVLEGGSGALPTRSLLDGVLLALWEECAEAGLFRWVWVAVGARARFSGAAGVATCAGDACTARHQRVRTPRSHAPPPHGPASTRAGTT